MCEPESKVMSADTLPSFLECSPQELTPFSDVDLLGQISWTPGVFKHQSIQNMNSTAQASRFPLALSLLSSCSSSLHHLLSCFHGLWHMARCCQTLGLCLSFLHLCSSAFQLPSASTFLLLSLLYHHCGLCLLGFKLHSPLFCLLHHFHRSSVPNSVWNAIWSPSSSASFLKITQSVSSSL